MRRGPTPVRRESLAGIRDQLELTNRLLAAGLRLWIETGFKNPPGQGGRTEPAKQALSELNAIDQALL